MVKLPKSIYSRSDMLRMASWECYENLPMHQADYSEAKIDHLATIFVTAVRHGRTPKKEAERKLRGQVFHLSTAFSPENT